jgi:hypothetical protein
LFVAPGATHLIYTSRVLPQTPIKVGQVFVAGGFPTHTYISRDERSLERKVQDYLDERYRILSVSGPTKTGKTVLMKRALKNEDAIWLSGGTISSIETFWSLIADQLQLFTQIESTQQSADSEARTMRGELGISVLKGSREGQSTTTYSTADRSMRERPITAAAREGLRSNLYPLVIDDFHYIPSEVQLQIVRGLKDLVFDGLPVIVIAVPHRAYDVVRVEKEMTGRVEQLEVGFWSDGELIAIAHQGFSALNVFDDGDGIAKRLAEESFSSPHLMQDFCLQVCKINNIRESVRTAIKLQPLEWREFFSDRSSSASRTAFKVLVRGPRQRSDRKPRTLIDGTTTDIYGAVLFGIAYTGPLISLTYEGLRAALREVLSSELPQRHEVTRVLEEMSKIARESIDGEPVVDYDESLSTLYISDPYFAFFLRWRVNSNNAVNAAEQVSIAGHEIEATGDIVVGGDFHGNVVTGDAVFGDKIRGSSKGESH